MGSDAKLASWVSLMDVTMGGVKRRKFYLLLLLKKRLFGKLGDIAPAVCYSAWASPPQ